MVQIIWLQIYGGLARNSINFNSKVYMKNLFKYSMSAVAILASAVTLSSCNDWTDPESLDIHYPSFEEQNPQLYADYIKDLKNYKAEEHKMAIVSFDNPKNPAKQAERLTAMPDSLDFICLNNPDEISPDTQAEMVKIREKGTRTIYRVDYSSFETDWKAMVKENPELTEEEALKYIGERTDAMLILCDKYNYDGMIVDYTGRSLVSMRPEVLAEYNGRQQLFFNKVLEWQTKHTDKVLIYYGNIQYLVPENMSMLKKYDYVILKTVDSSNADDLSLKAYLAIQAGEDVKTALYEGVNPVPTDRFIICVQLPQADDKDQIKGYWSTLNDKGEKILAAPGTALWMGQTSSDFTRRGIFIQNVQNDYYNNTYEQLREVIYIMNPNK
jgi:hypothetical protein